LSDLLPVIGGAASCTVKPGTKIFVAANSVECSTFRGEWDDRRRITDVCPPERRANGAHRHRRRQVRAGDRGGDTSAEYHPADNIFDQDAGTQDLSAGHGWVTLLHPLTPGTHTIVIVVTGNPPSRPRSSLNPAISVRGGASDPYVNTIVSQRVSG